MPQPPRQPGKDRGGGARGGEGTTWNAPIPFSFRIQSTQLQYQSRRAWLVLKWETTWEHWVLYTFFLPAGTLTDKQHTHTPLAPTTHTPPFDTPSPFPTGEHTASIVSWGLETHGQTNGDTSLLHKSVIIPQKALGHHNRSSTLQNLHSTCHGCHILHTPLKYPSLSVAGQKHCVSHS